MAATVHNLNLVKRNVAYRWRDVERDPDMEFLTRIIDESEKSIYAITIEVSRRSKGFARISSTTLHNWMKGKTKRPQNYTLTWVSFALGYERVWVKNGERVKK